MYKTPSVTTSDVNDYLPEARLFIDKPKFSQSNQYTSNLLQSTAITSLDDSFRIFLQCFSIHVSDCFRHSVHLYVRCITLLRVGELLVTRWNCPYNILIINYMQWILLKNRCVQTASRKRIPSGSILLGHHWLIMGDAYQKESESSGIESIIHPKGTWEAFLEDV